MMKKDLQTVLKELTKNNPTLSLSTCTPDGQPESSVVYFGMDDHSDIYFISKSQTHKVKNLTLNPKVSLLAQNIEDETCVQMAGVAEKLENQEDINQAFNLMMATLSGKIDWPPPIGKIDAGKLVFYRVKLSWARLGHFQIGDSDVFEELIIKESE